MRRCAPLTLSCPGVPGLWSVLLLASACTSTKPAAVDESPKVTPPALDLWDGVPPIAGDEDDVTAELKPVAGPRPPPGAAEPDLLPFPPPAPPSEQTRDPAPDLPLQVLRTSPTQKAPGLVGAVTATFNQAMVPLASVDDLELERSPLAISPQPPGKYRWLGTQMIAFEASGHLPFSTTYTATIAAGETSTAGARLAKPVAWRFSTPPLEISRQTPGPWGHVALDPVLVLTFNQDIRADELAAAIRLSGGGGSVALTRVPAGEYAALAEPYRSAAQSGRAERTLVLRPAAALRPDTRYSVTIPPGVYGEGPNASKKLTAEFTTYPPLTLSPPQCKRRYPWGCTVDGVTLQASTRLAVDPDIAAKVRVTPEVAGLEVTASGALTLRGEFRGLATYTLTVDAGVRDVHGQALARPFRTTFTLPGLEPALALAGVRLDPVVLEPSHAGVLDLRARGLTEVEVRARAFAPEALRELVDQRHGYRGRDEWTNLLRDAGPGVTHAVAGSRAQPVTIPIATRELASMPGSFLVVGARSNQLGDDAWKYRQTVEHVVEVTRLGVSAAVDSDSGVILVTDLVTGEPRAGVGLSLFGSRDGGVAWTGTSDQQGLATLTHGRIEGHPYVLARVADDAAYLPLQQTVDGTWSSWQHEAGKAEPRAFFYTEREPHKPGETVHLSGILRQETRGPAGGVAPGRSDVEATYVVHGPRDHEVARGALKVGPLGTFSVDIPLPADADTGAHRFELKLPGGWFGDEQTFHHAFAVETYRAPEFAVKVERPAAATLVYGDTLAAEVRATYLHGAPLVGATVRYSLRRSDAGFRPPGGENEAFGFGPREPPWWLSGGRGLGMDEEDLGGVTWGGETTVKQGTGETDARGVLAVEHLLRARETPVGASARPAASRPDADEPPAAGTYTLEAQVTDQNRQAIAGRQSFVVHNAEEYVGLRSDRTVYRAGEQARVEAIVADVAGKRVAGRKLRLALARRETKRTAVQQHGRWAYKYETVDVPAGECSPTSEAAPVRCEFQTGKSGDYVVWAEVADARGRVNKTRHEFYVHGEDAVVWDQDQRRVDVVPDKPKYRPGETATLLLRSPFDAARGLLIIEREGILEHRPLTVQGGAATIEVPLTAAMTPGVDVSVMLVRGRVEVPGAPADQDLGRPAVAAGRIKLAIDDSAKRIGLTLVPERGELAPKDTLRLEIQARDADGEPQKAAVALMVVDEAVLSLMAHKTPDPLAFFHRPRESGVSLYDLRTLLLARRESDRVDEPPPDVTPDPGDFGGAFAVGDDDADVWGGLVGDEVGEAYGVGGLGLAGTGRGGGGAGDTGVDHLESEQEESVVEAKREVSTRHRGEEGRMGKPTLKASQAMANPISLRTTFAATAYFDPEVIVGETGTTTVEIPMPENLTTFRVMAVAVDPDRPDRFGSAEAAVKVRRPIMLRPSLPRFVNFGDSFQASVMVDNQTAEDQAIVVGTRGANVALPGPTQVPVEVPAGQSREVRFPMAAERAGTMRLQFAALSNGGRDATELALPVHWPASRQAFADYGATDASVLRALKLPEDALAGFGGLELSLSSTALKGLEDAVKYLVEYEYECTEQVASRLLPIFVLGPALEQFPIASVRDLERREAIAAAGVARVFARQNGDGGFRSWDDPGRSSPYLTTWASFALLEGKKAGFKVDERRLDAALDYLARYAASGESTPWGRYYDHTSRAFAVWLLTREGRGAELFDRVYARRAELPLYARVQLLSAAHRLGRGEARRALEADLRARVTETARTAHFAEKTSEEDAFGLQVLMHSDVQTDAVALMALLELDPNDPLLPKVIAGIMDDRDARRGGRWTSTHANAWALLAASRYFAAVEKEVPDYVARVWLDAAFAGEQAFKGRSMATREQQVPMARLLKEQPRALLLAKDGPGKLYYRLGLRYAPADLTMTAQSQGLSVFRTYEPLGQGGAPPDPESVRRMPDGSYEVKAGSLVRVNLTLVVKDRVSFVVVDDPLPAGFEGENPKFATTTRDATPAPANPRPLSPLDIGDDGWWWRPWWTFSHTELRDDRMLLFADYLPGGVYTHSYTARATTIGAFQLPPVRAEAMYAPELFGHSASSSVKVVE